MKPSRLPIVVSWIPQLEDRRADVRFFQQAKQVPAVRNFMASA